MTATSLWGMLLCMGTAIRGMWMQTLLPSLHLPGWTPLATTAMEIQVSTMDYCADVYNGCLNQVPCQQSCLMHCIISSYNARVSLPWWHICFYYMPYPCNTTRARLLHCRCVSSSYMLCKFSKHAVLSKALVLNQSGMRFRSILYRTS